jgi:membrane fusion protein (multidrug efflux system)
MSEHGGKSSSVDAPVIADAGAAVDRDGKSTPTDSASKAVPPASLWITRRRKLLIGVLGALVIAAAVFGIPWIRFVLSTVSTDDAFVNGHVTFVAPRIHGQVSRVLVDDNNRVHKGIFLLNWTRNHFGTQSQ